MRSLTATMGAGLLATAAALAATGGGARRQPRRRRQAQPFHRHAARRHQLDRGRSRELERDPAAVQPRLRPADRRGRPRPGDTGRAAGPRVRAGRIVLRPERLGVGAGHRGQRPVRHAPGGRGGPCCPAGRARCWRSAPRWAAWSARWRRRTAPGRIDGALTTCGIVAGGINLNKYQLDGEYALAQLLLPGQQVQLVRFADADRRARHGRDPAGRRRAGAARPPPGGPGWRSRWPSSTCRRGRPSQAAPAPASDPAAQEAAQYDVEFTGSFSTLDFIEAGRPSIDQADGRQRQLDRRRELRGRPGPLAVPAGGGGAVPRGRAQPARATWTR